MDSERSPFPAGSLLSATSRTGMLFGYATSTTAVQLLIPSSYTPPGLGENVFWRPLETGFTLDRWKAFVAGYKASGGVYELVTMTEHKYIANPALGLSFDAHFTRDTKAEEAASSGSARQFNDGWVEFKNTDGKVIGGCATRSGASVGAMQELWQVLQGTAMPVAFLASFMGSDAELGVDELDKQISSGTTSSLGALARYAYNVKREFMGLP